MSKIAQIFVAFSKKLNFTELVFWFESDQLLIAYHKLFQLSMGTVAINSAVPFVPIPTMSTLRHLKWLLFK